MQDKLPASVTDPGRQFSGAISDEMEAYINRAKCNTNYYQLLIRESGHELPARIEYELTDLRKCLIKILLDLTRRHFRRRSLPLRLCENNNCSYHRVVIRYFSSL